MLCHLGLSPHSQNCVFPLIRKCFEFLFGLSPVGLTVKSCASVKTHSVHVDFYFVFRANMFFYMS